MNSKAHQRNQNLVRQYTDQPEVLPATVRACVEAAWGHDEPIQLYAMADLDPALRLVQHWVCLGPTRLAVVKATPGVDEPPVLRSFARDDIRETREIFGLSSNSIVLESEPGEPALAVVRYTQRQRQAMGAIVFVLQQAIKGKPFNVERFEPDVHYADAISEPIRTAQASFSDNNRAVFWRLLAYLKPYRVKIALGLVAAILMTALMLVPPYLTKQLIDGVVSPYAEALRQAGDDPAAAAELPSAWKTATRTAWILLGGLVVTLLFRQVFLWIRLRWMAIIGEYVARDLRRDIYDHLHRLSIQYFSKTQTGSIISRVSSDSDRIWEFIAFGITEASVALLMILGLTTMMMVLDWQLGLFVLIPIPLIFLLIYWNGKAMHSAFLRIWRKWSHLTAVISDTIPGVNVVKAFNQEDHERARFGERNESFVDETKRVHHIWTTFWPLFILGLQFMQVCIWAFAIPRLFGREPGAPATLEVGVFVGFLLYLGMFFWPLETFAQISRMMNRSLSSAYRIFEVLDTEPEVVDRPDARRLDDIRGRISFENVVFGYDPVRQIIKGVSFEVQPGEMIGLVGPSGAGKTTIINLIARFYDPNSGSIRIDGVPLDQVDSGHYRSRIGMVLQDPYLFHGTLLENIRYGHHEAGVEDVIAAARAANAHDFICKLPQGYDTIVGERGHTLSGGERQRISIARAVLHNPRILILDEATSSVDTETERKIQEAIDRLTANRTVIAIAHRLSTLRKADRLLVMKDGHLVEVGSHEELLKKPDGVYHKLYDMQRELHEAYAL